jgi:hypothetical protein
MEDAARGVAVNKRTPDILWQRIYYTNTHIISTSQIFLAKLSCKFFGFSNQLQERNDNIETAPADQISEWHSRLRFMRDIHVRALPMH